MGQKNSDTYKACSFFFLWNKKIRIFCFFFPTKSPNFIWPRTIPFWKGSYLLPKTLSHFWPLISLQYTPPFCQNLKITERVVYFKICVLGGDYTVIFVYFFQKHEIIWFFGIFYSWFFMTKLIFYAKYHPPKNLISSFWCNNVVGNFKINKKIVWIYFIESIL